MKRYIAFLLLIAALSVAEEARGQWRKIGSFPQPVGCIYIADSGKSDNYRAIIGTYFNYANPIDDEAEVWRTEDGGKNWQKVFKGIHSEPAISDIDFKDSLTGWFSIYPMTWAIGVGGCYKTTNGGITWTKLSLDAGRSDCTALHYNKKSNSLLLSRYFDNSIVSNDEGITWQKISTRANWNNGYAFVDSIHGIVASEVTDVGIVFHDYYQTSDGGLSWQKLAFQEQTWQPLAFKGSFFILTNYSLRTVVPLFHPNYVIYRSDDLGISWKQIFQFPTSMVGTLRADSNSIYAQSGHFFNSDPNTVNPLGILRSTDEGVSWSTICGPDNFDETRFYVSDYGIWAGDSVGGLWFNRTKKGAGPRLQIGKNNSSRHSSVRSSDFFPIDIYNSKEAYYESINFVDITVNYSGPLRYVRDSVAFGWQIKNKQVNDSNIKYTLQRTSPNAPQTDSFLLRIYFLALVAKETTASVILDEINFNGDTTFRDCMIASLSQTDSLFIDIQDQCGDSILRQFMARGEMPVKIISIHPNPAQDDIDIEINSAIKQDAKIELRNALGAKVYFDSPSLGVGKNMIRLTTKTLSSGVYLVRVVSDGGEAEQSLVISR